MGTYVVDAGSKYIVKNERLEKAYKYLEEHGEFAYVVDKEPGRTILGADGMNDMFCGEVSYHYESYCADFMREFCEPSSYACFKDLDQFEFVIVWKDAQGNVNVDGEGWENLFWELIEKLDKGEAWEAHTK